MLWCDDTELKATLAKEELVFDSARSPIVVCDEKGVISQVNAMTSQVFGYTHVSRCGPVSSGRAVA